MMVLSIDGVKKVIVRETAFQTETGPFHSIDIFTEMEDGSLHNQINCWRGDVSSGFPELEVIRHGVDKAEPKEGMDHVYEAKGGE